MKRCSSCDTVKAPADFARNRARPDGLADRCKSCMNNNEAYKKQKREYGQSAAGQAMLLRSHLKLQFNMTVEQKQEMFKNQDGKCAICSKAFQNLKAACVDHDHSNGKVRDLLCKPCNAFLGKIEKSQEVLTNLASYVEKHRAKNHL